MLIYYSLFFFCLVTDTSKVTKAFYKVSLNPLIFFLKIILVPIFYFYLQFDLYFKNIWLMYF